MRMRSKRKNNILVSSLIILMMIYHASPAQSDSTQFDRKKLKWVVGTSSVAYAGSLIALNQLWYKDFPKEKFHFFDDSREWKQVDKIGHLYSSYHISRAGHQTLSWAGVSPKKSYIYGGLMGLIFMTPIEIMDGYSAEYGASASDIVANVGGVSLFVIQGLLWNETRIRPKYSFKRSHLAPMRPNLLGKSLSEEILKDYNAQTYWLSFDIHAFHKPFPKWINIAVGYGAHDMIYANDFSNEANGLKSYRQYYIGLDWDLSHIKSRHRFINALLFIGDMIRLPAPAFEYNSKGDMKFHWTNY